MYTSEDLLNYKIYLKKITQNLNKYFEDQKEYVFCKEGCSHCCEYGEYPFSNLEFVYLMIGVNTLPAETVKLIENNIEKLKEKKSKLKENERFIYQCPFLIDKKCALYEYRGIICRTHGLAFYNKEDKLLVPECVKKGLNYSNVYDFDKHSISAQKYEEGKYKNPPIAHNISLNVLTNLSFVKDLNLDFGETKSLIDWF